MSEKTLKILVIDAQGGGMGRLLVQSIKKMNLDAPYEIIAVGTNSRATGAMLKAGADHGATGENSVVVCANQADLIIAPMAILLVDSLYGEITEKMVAAVGRSNAKKIFIPFTHNQDVIVGIKDYTMTTLIDLALQEIETGNDFLLESRNDSN